MMVLMGIRRFGLVGVVVQALHHQHLPPAGSHYSLKTIHTSRNYLASTISASTTSTRRVLHASSHSRKETARVPAATASFTSPTEIRETGCARKGKGVFATKDMDVGELVLVEKVLVCVHFDDEPEEGEKGMKREKDDFGKGDASGTGVLAKLERKVPRQAREDPALLSCLLTLHPRQPPPNEKEPRQLASIDPIHLRKIVAQNAFIYISPNSPSPTTQACHTSIQISTKSAALYPLASHLNHSCVFNTQRVFHSDVLNHFLILRTTKPISAGTELTIPYLYIDADTRRRQRTLSQLWGFRCSCLLCESESEGQGMVERGVLLEEAGKVLGRYRLGPMSPEPGLHLIERMEELVEKIERTHEGERGRGKGRERGMPRLALVPLLHWLSRAYTLHEMPERAAECMVKLLGSYGYRVGEVGGKQYEGEGGWRVDCENGVLIEGVVDALAELARFYGTEGGELMVIASKLYVAVNGDVMGFEEKYGRLD